MAVTWGTSKLWTSHFTAPPASSANALSMANGNVNVIQKPMVFTQSPRTVSKCSSTSSKSIWSSKTRPRARGIVYELEPVPIDPSIDPDWDLCFNCWKPDHSHKECKYPKYYDYCRNCGRRGVNWTTCPRCAKGYINYQKWRVSNNRPEFIDWRERPVVSKKRVENSSKDNRVSLGQFMSLDESKAKEIRPLMSIPVQVSSFENGSQSVQKDLPVDKSFPTLGNTKQQVLSSPRPNSAGEANNAQISAPKPNGKLYSLAIRNMVLENDHANQLIQNGKQSKPNSLGESLISSEEGDYNEDDEDLDGIIFDDGETNLPEQSTSSTTQDFITLIELVKHLSIETQNKVVEDFLQQSRVIMDRQ